MASHYPPLPADSVKRHKHAHCKPGSDLGPRDTGEDKLDTSLSSPSVEPGCDIDPGHGIAGSWPGESKEGFLKEVACT